MRLDPLMGKARGKIWSRSPKGCLVLSSASYWQLLRRLWSQLAFVFPLELPPTRRGGSAVWATAYSPYQPCPGLRHGEDTPASPHSLTFHTSYTTHYVHIQFHGPLNKHRTHSKIEQSLIVRLITLSKSMWTSTNLSIATRHSTFVFVKLFVNSMLPTYHEQQLQYPYY